jgi:hypothetical protein
MSELPRNSQIPYARSPEPFWPGVHGVVAGDPVRIRDAAGDWWDAIADSSVERGHKFPILWIKGVGKNGQPYRMPWPIDAVTSPT